MPTYYRFRNITTQSSKICVFRNFTFPSRISSRRKGFPSALGYEIWSEKLDSLGYPAVKSARSHGY